MCSSLCSFLQLLHVFWIQIMFFYLAASVHFLSRSQDAKFHIHTEQLTV
jgi:hypothetical protein